MNQRWKRLLQEMMSTESDVHLHFAAWRACVLALELQKIISSIESILSSSFQSLCSKFFQAKKRLLLEAVA
uniref:Uncharacterized protein n=1 Tax=Setaria viridis TaxID=4556 RepID=A0A4U6UBX2_SETVI|nr:hypothetical protein SEVIR_7G333900v2 [Setaria viridis]